MQRIVIIGNSGSGKTYLAVQIGTQFGLPVTHLDALFWEPGGFNVKRPKELVLQDIEAIKQSEQWIIEGVFGELAAHFVENAEGLIWLEMDWDTCQSNLLRRGSESEKQRDPEAAEASFQRLLVWASQYWARDDARSHSGHQALFETFQGRKWTLHSREEVDTMIGDLSNFG